LFPVICSRLTRIINLALFIDTSFLLKAKEIECASEVVSSSGSFILKNQLPIIALYGALRKTLGYEALRTNLGNT